MSYYVIRYLDLRLVNSKNKQYKIEKGLLLFTQPRSPYFYGKIRLNRKYVTKSFAPVTDLESAKVMLYSWQRELLAKDLASTSVITPKENFKSRSVRKTLMSSKIVKIVSFKKQFISNVCNNY